MNLIAIIAMTSGDANISLLYLVIVVALFEDNLKRFFNGFEQISPADLSLNPE